MVGSESKLKVYAGFHFSGGLSGLTCNKIKSS